MARGAFHNYRCCRELRAIPLVAAILCAANALGQQTLYVNQAATGSNGGTCWADAFVDLHDALAVALPGDEIWVAAGTYKPDRGTGDRMMSFELVSGVGVYGGFSGAETCRDERNPQTYVAVLSGDLLGNDDPLFVPTSNCCYARPDEVGCEDPACAEVVDMHVSYEGCLTEGWTGVCAAEAVRFCCELCMTPRCDNSYNVLRAVGVAGPAVLSGFEIRAGEANGYADLPSRGGGLVLRDSDISIEDCRFLDNAANAGAAISKEYDDAHPIVQRCSFEGNRGNPAVYGRDKTLLVRDCVFRGNLGTGLWVVSTSPIENVVFIDNSGSGLYGSYLRPIIKGCSFVRNGLGGMIVDSAYVSECHFIGNTYFGGILGGSSLTVVNSLFVGNEGSAISGGMGSTAIVNSTFVGNSSLSGPTGGVVLSGTGYVRNSIFWGNNGTLEWMQLYLTDPLRANLYVDNSIIQGWTGQLGGVGNSGVDPMFVDADGTDDILGTEDDDLRLLPSSPAINAGDPDETYLPATDLDGHARVLCGRVDIGAYEFGVGDYDCNQTVDLTDFANWPSCMTGPDGGSDCESFDFDGDGDVDLLDFYLLEHVFVAP